MSKLALRSPSLKTAVRPVAGNGSSYYAFPSIRLSPDGSEVYCVYKRGTHNQYPPQVVYFVKRAIAFGSAWSSPVVVMTYDEATNRAPGDPDMIVTSTGRIIVTTTYSSNGGVYYRRPHLAYSDDGGVTWIVVGEITSVFGKFDTPGKAVELAGTIYLTHYGQETGDSGYRAGLTSATDDGVTWGSATTIWNGNSYGGRQFEEPGIRVLPDGKVAITLRVDYQWQCMLTHSDSIGGTWRVPFGFAVGCGKAEFGVFADGTMLFCQRWPAADNGGQAVSFYVAKLGSDGVIQTSRPSFLDPLAQIGTTRRQMYAGIEVLDAATALVVWATDDGTFTGEASIYEAEIAV